MRQMKDEDLVIGAYEWYTMNNRLVGHFAMTKINGLKCPGNLLFTVYHAMLQ